MTKWRVMERVYPGDMVDRVVDTYTDYGEAVDDANRMNESWNCVADFYVEEVDDPVNRPDHYRLANGTEVIDVTENLNFNSGNVVKYVCRAGRKGGQEKTIEDLKKAQWYLSREIERQERLRGS